MTNRPDLPHARAGDLVAVYGTLRHGGRLHHVLGTASGRAVHVGDARIEGDLYEVAPELHAADVDTSYPCLHDGTGRAVVEVYEVRDPLLWSDLDELEGFDPAAPDECEYHRRRVRLLDPRPDTLAARDAWTYVYVRAAPDPTRHIPGGDWIAFTAER